MNIIQILEDEDFNGFSSLKHWNGTPVQNSISLPHHSWWVALFARLISEELNLSFKLKSEILNYALIHDLDEMFTGDVLHVLKHNEVNGDKIKYCIDEFVTLKLLRKFPSTKKSRIDKYFLYSLGFDAEISRLVKLVVKLADNLSMFHYMLNEKKMGNTSFNNKFSYVCDLILSNCDDIHEEFDWNAYNVDDYGSYEFQFLKTVHDFFETYKKNNR